MRVLPQRDKLRQTRANCQRPNTKRRLTLVNCVWHCLGIADVLIAANELPSPASRRSI